MKGVDVTPPGITLSVVEGPCDHRESVFRQAEIFIGRGESFGAEAEMFKLEEDASVSRDQAAIIFEAGRYHVVNRSKRKSTAVNGRFLDKSVLKNGDMIEVGREKTRIRVKIHGTAPQEAEKKVAGPTRRFGVWISAGIVLLVLVAAVLVRVFCFTAPPIILSDEDRLARAGEARNAGELTVAIDCLRPSITNSRPNLDLYLETKKLHAKFEKARKFESALQLDRALDAWQMISAEALGKDDPLQVWVKTGQVARLEHLIKEIGR